MKLRVSFLFSALLFALVLTSSLAQALGPARSADGTQWTTWSMQDKLCYVQGFGNYADFVTEAQMQQKKSYDYCLSKVLVDQLKNKSLGQVVEAVDVYYQNSANLNKPVVEAIIRSSTNVCPR